MFKISGKKCCSFRAKENGFSQKRERLSKQKKERNRNAEIKSY